MGSTEMECLVGTCPICYKKDAAQAGRVLGRDDRDYDVLQCQQCGLLFVSPFPRLSSKDSEEIYDADYYGSNWGEAGRGYFDLEKSESMRREAERQRRVIENETGVIRGNILDIGCGDGRYLGTFAQAGWHAVGVEVSREAVERAERQEGVKILHGTVDSTALENATFDVIRMKHCIEHLSFPKETLISVARLLRPGGFLVLDTDNADGLRSRCERLIQRTAGPVANRLVKQIMRKDLRRRFGRLSPPIHLLYFSPTSLCHALQSVGLTVHKMFSVHHGHPIWFPLVHPCRCHPLEALFRCVDRVGYLINRGEALVCFAQKRE